MHAFTIIFRKKGWCGIFLTLYYKNASLRKKVNKTVPLVPILVPFRVSGVFFVCEKCIFKQLETPQLPMGGLGFLIKLYVIPKIRSIGPSATAAGGRWKDGWTESKDLGKIYDCMLTMKHVES